MTPYEKLKALPGATQRLRPAVTFDALDQRAHAMTDLKANRARDGPGPRAKRCSSGPVLRAGPRA